VLCVPVEYRRSKNHTDCSIGNSPLCGNPNTVRATFSVTLLLQRAVELHRKSLILSCCTPEPPLAEMALRKGASAVYFHHAGANCFAGNPPPRGNPGLKCTRTDPILKKFDWILNFKLKINVQRVRTSFRSIQSKLSPISWAYPYKHTQRLPANSSFFLCN
jgi:hypothetical protein